MDINQDVLADSACSFRNFTNDVNAKHYPRIGDEYQVAIPELMESDTYVFLNQGSGIKMDDDSFSSQKKDAEFDCNKNSCCSSYFPRANEWKDIECKSFLLGLYSFGKKLLLVKEFVETRSMSDVLTYYYAKFYRSTEYIRWSQSRKLEGSIKEDKIYTGWRRHELLSRITPHVSSDSKQSLKKVSRSFKNGQLSVENYLFTLKKIAGISLLVGAVAIGKEEEDLTRTSFHRKKRNKLSVACTEPIGKPLSSPTEEEVKDLAVETAILSSPSALPAETGQGTIEIGQTLPTKADNSTQKAELSTLRKDNEPSTEKSLSWPVIDLNQPYVSSESGTDEPPPDNVHSLNLKSSALSETNNHLKLLNPSDDTTRKEVPVIEGRRQSSRSRELTTKAAEAIAADFLGPKKRRKGKNSVSSMNYDNVESAIHCSSYLSATHDHLELNSINNATRKEKPAETCERKSTRNRKLTTKALEAIALDFVPEETTSGVNSSSKSSSSRRVRPKRGPATLHRDGYINISNPRSGT